MRKMYRAALFATDGGWVVATYLHPRIVPALTVGPYAGLPRARE